MGKVIGIDLGTTNSVMAIRVLKSDIIPNKEGKTLTPSVVAYTHKAGLFGFNKKEEIIVGDRAQDLLLQDPENTIVSIKRLMGRSFNDKEIQALKSNPSYANKIVAPTKGTAAGVAIKLKDGYEVSPQMVSGQILSKLKADAEAYLNDEITEAVITVPAYFNEKQKHATYQAAELAGFKISRLLAEPSAAAIAYGIDNASVAQTILVYDFGGGTLDISILSFADGHFMEQAKGGDMWLGGDDIDQLLGRMIIQKLEKEYQLDSFLHFIETLNQSDRLRLSGEIRRAAEKAKISLSEQNETIVEINSTVRTSSGKRIQVELEITRSNFESIISPLIDKSRLLVEDVLQKVHFTPDMIDCVLMVGGSSAIPAFQASLQAQFGVDKIKIHERPMHAIAEGAAILAKKLAGSEQESYELGQVMYRSAHDYYLKLASGEQMLLIEKQTPLPATINRTLKYEHPAQLIGHFCFSSQVGDHFESIGDLWLSHFPEAIGYDSGQKAAEVEFTFSVTEDELVKVDVQLKGNSKIKMSKTISRGGEDEHLFAQLSEAIESINKRDIDAEVKSNQGFNFLYYSAALAQLITKEISEELSNTERDLESKTRQLSQKLNQIKELCSVEDQESDDAAFWNRFLFLQNISYMSDFFDDKEQLKSFRNMVEIVKQSLLQIEETQKLKELLVECEILAEKAAPEAGRALTFGHHGKIALDYHGHVRVGLTQE